MDALGFDHPKMLHVLWALPVWWALYAWGFAKKRQALERFAAANFTYQNAADTDADGIGDANAGPIADAICSPDSVAQGRYTIAVNGTAVGFVLTATPAGRMNGDGLMTFDSVGNRGWDENNDGDTADAGEQDWAE